MYRVDSLKLHFHIHTKLAIKTTLAHMISSYFGRASSSTLFTHTEAFSLLVCFLSLQPRRPSPSPHKRVYVAAFCLNLWKCSALLYCDSHAALPPRVRVPGVLDLSEAAAQEVCEQANSNIRYRWGNDATLSSFVSSHSYRPRVH